MGKKKVEEPPAAEEAPKNPVKKDEAKDAEEEVEDPPIIKELKKLDDEYLAIERKYEREVMELQKKYSDQQEPLLRQRLEILVSGLPEGNEGNAPAGEASPKAEGTGTPGLKDFWLTALCNVPQFSEEIQEWDKPVLSYLRDITKEHLDQTDSNKGFKLTFHFVENPYFTNKELVKEYVTKESSPWTGEIETEEIKATTIDWKPGKNITVEVVKKKGAKGGGAKKAKKTKDKEEPRESFFRTVFRNLNPEEGAPENLFLGEDDDSDMDEEGMLEMAMENDYEMGCAIRDMVIPFAVRWYTGEASPEDDDDDEDEEEEDDEGDEDDEDDEDDDEDDTPVKGKAAKKAGVKKTSPKLGAKGGGKGGGGKDGQEECKQQ